MINTSNFSMVKEIEPIKALAGAESKGVLAVITAVDGPSYRPLGATMAILDDGTLIGSLSSGCIEADIALHAARCLKNDTPICLLYGLGSPFADIKLPCGGGLEVALIPAPCKATLNEVVARYCRRQVSTISINVTSGNLEIHDHGVTHRNGNQIILRIEPETYFCLFGKGPEATSMASLVQAAGYPNILLSPDEESLAIAAGAGCDTRHLKTAEFPANLATDRFSAIVLFFHDHEWEPPILSRAILTDAFYIGAQGSQKAAVERKLSMAKFGVSQADQARISGPIGLIPSVRDARALAVSVLAEVLQKRIAMALLNFEDSNRPKVSSWKKQMLIAAGVDCDCTRSNGGLAPHG